MGLASLDMALREISSRSLHVTVVDDDIVTEANLGRQPFFRCDLGNSKARILQYPLRKRPLAIVTRAVRATNPDAVIVNDAGDDVFARALDVLLASR